MCGCSKKARSSRNAINTPGQRSFANGVAAINTASQLRALNNQQVQAQAQPQQTTDGQGMTAERRRQLRNVIANRFGK